MKKLVLSLAMAAVATSFASAQEASFDHPIGLRYLGTIKNPDVQPACSYLSRNPMNDGAFLWAPVDSKVKYTNTSTGEAQSWNWTTPGGTLEDATAKDAIIKYPNPEPTPSPRSQPTSHRGQRQPHTTTNSKWAAAQSCVSPTAAYGL